jgi:hypothetical protein
MFVFSDVLHLLTLLRNHFLDNGYILSHNIISKNSIKQFLKISDSSNLKIGYKITQHMLDVKGSQRQKVSTAAKLLSETTANVIKYCGDNKLISDPNYRATSAFIKLVKRALGPRLPVPVATKLREMGKRYKRWNRRHFQGFTTVAPCVCVCVQRREIRGCFHSATGVGEPVEEVRIGWRRRR